MDNGDFFKNHNEELREFLIRSKRQSKEETLRKINAGSAFYESLDSPHGRILLKCYSDILDEKFNSIVSYKHDDKLTIEDNYHNILTHIVSYKAVAATGDIWAGKLKSLEEGMKEVRKVNAGA